MSHTIGTWYKIGSEFYMLAQVEESMFCLIGLDGNRWTNPIKCIPSEGMPVEISDDDFKNLSWGLTNAVSIDVVEWQIPYSKT